MWCDLIKINVKTFSQLGIFSTTLAVALVNSIPAIAQLESNPITEARQKLKRHQGIVERLDTSMSQINSVSKLRDVQPTEWAYEALGSLVERYGCIVGYPDNTYRGNGALTRWEFAAGLNACINTLERLLQEGITVSRQDLDTFKRLAQEFADELVVLGAKIDNLEARVSFLEDNAFSTTTKLFVQNIWSLDDTFGDRIGEDENDSQTQFGYRIRFNMETSFSGQDLLRTRLQVGNLTPTTVVTGTNMTRLNYDNDTNNDVVVPHLLYRTPLTQNLQLTVGPVGIGYTDITSTLMPPTVADDSLGIPSRFGQYNSLYRRGGGGLAFNWNILGEIVGANIGASDPKNRDLILTVGYLSIDNDNPTPGNGFFNGGYHTLAQLAYYGESGVVGVAYSRTYNTAGRVNLTGGHGTILAIQPFGDSIATNSDSYNLQGFVRITDNFQIHGWVGYYRAYAEGTGISNISDGLGGTLPISVNKEDNADLWNGAFSVTFPDVGGEGFLPGVLFGIPPTVSDSDVKRDRDTPYHIEVFYRFQLTDNIAITPGFWTVINPEGDSRNDTQWVGHIRSSFNF